ncbi:hypothetical protein A9200_08170 [Maribacter hydrothermalis]|uniref:Uncharacterized protein n=2 Tax=Maribacter hydrothermalis TaxID=1836467 RepID=A0A1B7Z1H5_9FLAO|nr:hypothetical protein BTR34_12280 [Maribacter hydrothermalis]OBR36400.1 hypothetical protein A9200_08170 [Maribacter hydrothermalis]
MMDAFSNLQKHNYPINANLIILSVSLISGFGFFLGKSIRFNSWHLIARPQLLIAYTFKSLVI